MRLRSCLGHQHGAALPSGPAWPPAWPRTPKLPACGPGISSLHLSGFYFCGCVCAWARVGENACERGSLMLLERLKPHRRRGRLSLASASPSPSSALGKRQTLGETCLVHESMSELMNVRAGRGSEETQVTPAGGVGARSPRDPRKELGAPHPLTSWMRPSEPPATPALRQATDPTRDQQRDT